MSLDLVDPMIKRAEKFSAEGDQIAAAIVPIVYAAESATVQDAARQVLANGAQLGYCVGEFEETSFPAHPGVTLGMTWNVLLFGINRAWEQVASPPAVPEVQYWHHFAAQAGYYVARLGHDALAEVLDALKQDLVDHPK